MNIKKLLCTTLILLSLAGCTPLENSFLDNESEIVSSNTEPVEPFRFKEHREEQVRIEEEIPDIQEPSRDPSATVDLELLWPVDFDGRVVIRSGCLIVNAYHTGRNDYLIDEGLRFIAPPDTDILAAANGIVAAIEYDHHIYGNAVTLNHGETIQTRYAHCNQIMVALGDEIDAGQVIASVGHSGRATAPILGFHLLVDGASIDSRPNLYQEYLAHQKEQLK